MLNDGSPPVDPAKDQAKQEQRNAQQQFNGSGGKAPQEVAVEQPATEIAQVPAQERTDHVHRAQAGSLVRVGSLHRHVHHHGAQLVQVKEQIGFKEVPFGDMLEIQFGQQASVDRGESVGGVEQLPVAGGQLGQERQHRIAE